MTRPLTARLLRAVVALVALLAVVALLAAGSVVEAADVTLVVEVPEGTPSGDAVYVAGSFQGWNPGNPEYRLSRRDDGAWEITLDLSGNVQFKFTRGSWNHVEKGPSGEEVANRTLRIAGAATHRFTVAAWADGGLTPPDDDHTLTGRVFSLAFPDILDGRRLWVWLPPGYADSGERYPVLYFWDGQNIFDHATSFSGEWQVDETCTRLIGEGKIRPLIVVGVENGGDARMREYTPWTDAQRGGGDGARHLDVLTGQIKPRIDELFRTRPEPEATGICGSSLGGLMAAYAAFEAPDTFGRAAAVSVSFSWADHALVRWVAEQDKAPRGHRLYVDTGTRESGRKVDRDGNGRDDHVDALYALEEAVEKRGYREGKNLLTVVDRGGQHHESAWA
ncbi:MAG: hypothetical protein HKN12_00940, partial [Gemmatimonadetes bacterium]|nr:hypothetical protein [Gemmatimonadota bacterium]